jgi:transposase
LLGGGGPVFTPVKISPDLLDGHREAPAVQGTEADVRAEILLANGRRLAVPVHIDAGALARLVQVLERA